MPLKKKVPPAVPQRNRNSKPVPPPPPPQKEEEEVPPPPPQEEKSLIDECQKAIQWRIDNERDLIRYKSFYESMLNSNGEKKEKKPFTIATTDMIESPPPSYEQWEQGELRKAMQNAISKRPKVRIPGPITPPGTPRIVRKPPASLGPRPSAPPRKKVTVKGGKRKRKRTRKKRKKKSTRKKKKKKKKKRN